MTPRTTLVHTHFRSQPSLALQRYSQAFIAIAVLLVCSVRSSAQDCNNNGIPDIDEIQGAPVSLDFDGSDDYVRIPRAPSIEPSNEMTFEAWVRADSVGPSNSLICRISSDFGAGYILAWQWNGSGKIQLRIDWATNGSRIVTDTTPTTSYVSQWVHVAFTYSNASNSVVLYVNGVAKSSAAAVGPLLYSNSDLYIGNSLFGSGDDFDGRIDEVRLWNVARTPSQIAADMSRRLPATQAGLIGYWRFNEGTGQTVGDSTSNANHGFRGAGASVDATDPAWSTSGAPLLTNDCNGNGVLDSCDITAGAPDCNANQVPDACDLANTVLADSVADFSAVQGNNNWYYGYYVAPFASASFQLLNQYGPDSDFSNINTWHLQKGSGGFFTAIGQTQVHPNGLVSTGGRQNVGHWVCRRWISNRSGPVQLSGVVAKLSAQGCGGCDGEQARIVVDGVEVWNQFIAQTNSVGVSFNLSATLNVGSTVDFIIDPLGNDGQDYTLFTATIRGGDCNNNGILDACDILATPASDCNADGILDVCQSSADCNNNGVRDFCDIAAGTSSDCDLNGVPDSCQLAGGAPDCNANQVLDACDIGANNFALRFDGTNDLVVLPQSMISNLTTLTFEAWFKTSGSGVIYGYQNSAYPAGPGSWMPVVYVGLDGKLRGKWYNNQTPIIATTSSVNDGIWHHVALVGAINTQSLYLDGVIVSGSPMTGTIGHSGLIHSQIGNGWAGGIWPSSNTAFPFAGEIDNVRFWSIARTQAEIAADMHKSYLGPKPGLLTYLKMDAGTGQTVVDSSGHLNHGTLGTSIAVDTLDPLWVAAISATPASGDCDGNGVPDSCDADCNDNGIADTCDIDMGTSVDCNANGVPDSCDLSAGTSADCNEDGFPDECNPTYSVTHRFKACIDGNSLLVIRGGTVQWHHLGTGGAAAPGREPGCQGDQITYVDNVAWTPVWPEPYPAQIRYDAWSSVYSGMTSPYPLSEMNLSINHIASRDNPSIVQTPAEWNDYTFIMSFPDPSSGPFTYDIEIIAQYALDLDCNNNTQVDSCEIAAGNTTDCNANLIPDTCEVSSLVIANAALDFSGTQGYRNWYYGYYVAPYTSASFQLLTQYSLDSDFAVTTWHLQKGNGGFWTALGSTFVSPNGPTTCCGRQNVGHWTCRRWVSDRAGPVRLSGHVAKIAAQGCGGCDGEQARIYVDGVEVWSQFVAQTNSVGLDFNVPVTLNFGSKVDFVVDPLTYDGQDQTFFSVMIEGGDCNNNGVPDSCDIASATSSDCDGNGVPDECQPNTDCNNNGVRDLCEPAGRADCDGNGVTNYCQVAAGAPDCDGDWIPDNCDASNGNYVLTFDDLNDHVRVPRSPSLEPGTFTIELWAKLDNLQSRNSRMVRKIASRGFIFAADQNNDQRIQLRVDNSSTTAVADTQSHSAYIGQWHHFAAVYSPTQAKLYVDGVLKATTTHANGAATYTPDDLYIGAGLPASDTSEFFGGSIDEVRLWSIARTDAQIAADRFKSFADPRPGLVGNWKLNSGSGQIAVDSSGYGNHGQLGTDGLPAGDSADPVWNNPVTLIPGPSDCNGNNIPDACDIAAATVTDCNANNVPDSCESDCNNNGVADACDIAGGTVPDCNGNGIPDACDIAAATSTDVNSNGIPDSCEPDIRLIPVISIINPTSTSEIRSVQPSSINAVSRGTRYYIEVWASDVGSTNTGLTGAYTDVNFCGQTTATAVFHGGIFNVFPAGTIQSGKVDEFGGSALPNGGGVTPQWVRVGWIEMNAGTESAGCNVSLTPGAGGVAAFNRGLINSALIVFGSVNLVITPPAKTYDLDNNTNINVGDLSLFAGSWLTTVPPGNTNHDFDCDDSVGVSDLSWFATGWNKSVTDPTILYPPCDGGGGGGWGPGDEPGQQPTDVAFKIAVLNAPSSSDNRLTVPTSITNINEGQQYYVEIWSSDIGDINTGITSAYLDLMLPPTAAAVISINHNGIFTVFPSGAENDGVVDELGGSNLAADVGATPIWARLATVRLFADANRPVKVFSLTPSATGVAAYGRGGVSWDAIELDTVSIGTPGLGDLDADGDVDQADMALFINVLLGSDTNPGHIARSDMNADSQANGRDVQGFVGALTGP